MGREGQSHSHAVPKRRKGNPESSPLLTWAIDDWEREPGAAWHLRALPAALRHGREEDRVSSASGTGWGLRGRGTRSAVALRPVTPCLNDRQVLCQTQSPGKALLSGSRSADGWLPRRRYPGHRGAPAGGAPCASRAASLAGISCRPARGASAGADGRRFRAFTVWLHGGSQLVPDVKWHYPLSPQ